jgi:hypothetical protein
MKRTAISTIAALSLLAFEVSAAVPNMTEGLWEMVVKTQVPGTPANVPAQTVQRCMSAKDFADPRKTAPDKGGQCEITNHRMQGNTASWDISCKGPEPMKGSGTMTFEGQRYNGVQKVNKKQDGQTVQMTMNYAGRYLGPCKPGQK